MFQKIELADMVQYIVYKANGIDFFRLFKILYLANLHHLYTYGMPMLACEFHAYPSGPIPMVLFDCLKGYASCDNELMERLVSRIQTGSMDADSLLMADTPISDEFLSPAVIETLDHAMAENLHLSYLELKDKSCGTAWRTAIEQGQGTVISVESMAAEAGVSSDQMDYIREHLKIVRAMNEHPDK